VRSDTEDSGEKLFEGINIKRALLPIAIVIKPF